MEASLSRQKNLKRTQRFLPWIFCVALFFYLFKAVTLSELKLALSVLKLKEFFWFSLLYFLVILYGDTAGLYYFFNRFVVKIRYKEVLEVRGISFLVAVFNYLLGQAALAYYVKKKHQASFSKALGVVSFITVMDLMLVISSGLLGLSFSDHHLMFLSLETQNLFLKVLVLVLWCSYFVWGWFWHWLSDDKLKVIHQFSFCHRVLSHSIFLIFREATLKDYFALLFLRLPVLCVVILGLKFAFLVFGADLSLLNIYLFHPIVLLASSLPLTPLGLGTSQVLMIEFFAPVLKWTHTFISKEHLILLASLLWMLANQFYKILFGSFYYLKKRDKYWLNEVSNI